MMRVTSDEDAALRVHAYVDGELDPANALGVEASMAADPALAAERERIEVFRRLVREHLPPEEPPTRSSRPRRSGGRHAAPAHAALMARARGIDRSHRSRRKWCNVNASCAIRE